MFASDDKTLALKRYAADRGRLLSIVARMLESGDQYEVAGEYMGSVRDGEYRKWLPPHVLGRSETEARAALEAICLFPEGTLPGGTTYEVPRYDL